MRNFFQYIILCGVTLCSLTSCETDDTLFPEPSVAPQLSAVEGEVRIVLADGATRAAFEGMTRAMVATDGNLTWQTGDKFTLIAKNSAGADAFEPCAFSYWISATAGSRSFFRGVPNQRMADDSYTYYAVYPHTTPVEGTTATFSLPAQQDGKYGKTDFMVARATGGALRVCDDNPDTAEPLNELGITFKHQLHAMRFEIPRTGVLTSGVRRVHILFSEAVVGDIKVNMESSAVEYVNTSNKITVDFGAGSELQAGETFWVMTLPQAAFSRAVDIRFEDSQGNYTTRQLITLSSSQQYTAGRLTPIRMNVPSSLTGVTSLHCKIGSYAKLGEPITNLHLTLPAGYYFTDYANYRNSVANSSGEYVYPIFNDLFDNTLRNANLKLDYESKNAFIPTAVKLENTVNVGGRTDYSLEAPYLFEETFSGVSQFNYEMDTHSLTIKAKSLAEYGLNGWYGGRVGSNGGGANGAMAIAVRHETVAQYRGRLDSSGFSHIKEGKSVKIKVSFQANRSNKYAYLNFGLGLVSDGALNGSDGISQGSERLDPTTKSDITYTNIDTNDYTYTFNTVSSNNRLSWVVDRDYDFVGNGWESHTWYVYLDNVRVSIVQ